MKTDELISGYLFDRLTDKQMLELSGWIKADTANARQFAQSVFIHRRTHEDFVSQKIRQLVDSKTSSDQCSLDSVDMTDTRLFEAASDSDEFYLVNKPDADEIKRRADAQLARFLAEQQALEQNASKTTAKSWDISELTEKAEVFAKSAFNTLKKVAAVIIILLGIGLYASYLWDNRVVATIVTDVHAQWEKDFTEGKVRRGWNYLQEGFAQFKFNSGAEVILQAPCEFKMLTGNRMYLESGRITATVPEKAVGFTVQSENSQVVDYGTQFGVSIDGTKESDVRVFDGQIELVNNTENVQQAKRRLTEGQGARVDNSGKVHFGIKNDKLNIFTLNMPESDQLGIPGINLSLADLLGGGNGFGTGKQNHGINPISGLLTDNPNPGLRRLGTGKYVTVDSLRYIDGVFIPDSNDGPLEVTSQGHIFDQCPDTSGTFWVDLSNEPYVLTQNEKRKLTLDQIEFGTKQYPVINMHANMGVTFDLNKIRNDIPGTIINGFESVYGISETIDSGDEPPMADFWVLVDGKTRFYRKSMQKGQSGRIHIPIYPKDRFLSLVTTECDKKYGFDWCMFGKPALLLKSE